MKRLLAFLLALGGLAADAQAERLTIALSTPEIRINSNFSGTTITIFGVIERDAATVSRTGGYEVAIVVRGPPETVVARRKERFLGVWANGASETFANVPSFYTLVTTRNLEEMSSSPILRRLEIGFDNIDFTGGERSGAEDPEAAAFRAAFLRLKQQSSLYAEQIGGVSFIGGSVFRATVWIPANVPTGHYTAGVYLFSGTALLATAGEGIEITKIGFEQFMFEVAHQRAAIYGLACVALALVTGWLAGVIFRRD